MSKVLLTATYELFWDDEGRWKTDFENWTVREFTAGEFASLTEGELALTVDEFRHGELSNCEGWYRTLIGIKPIFLNEALVDEVRTLLLGYWWDRENDWYNTELWYVYNYCNSMNKEAFMWALNELVEAGEISLNGNPLAMHTHFEFLKTPERFEYPAEAAPTAMALAFAKAA